MQTHRDMQHDFVKILEARAKKGRESKTSQITTGKPGEEPLARWKATNGVHVTHMQDDEQGILRVSLGGGDNIPLKMDYLTIRGKVGECIHLLEKAIAAMKESPE